MAPSTTPKKPPPYLRFSASLIGVVAVIASFLAPAAQASSQPGIPKATARTAVLHGSALRVPVLNPAHAKAQGAIAPLMPGPRSHHPPAAIPRTGAVPVTAGHRTALAPAVSATILNSFQGTPEDGGIFPPDPTGAAGPSNVVTGSNAETMTDVNAGWTTPDHTAEIADLCGPAGNLSLPTGSFGVVSLWSNQADACAVSG